MARGDAEAAREGGRELAELLAGTPLMRLVLEVLEGGEFLDMRIAELCEALLDAGVGADRGREAAGAASP